jgi:hypothetical protein
MRHHYQRPARRKLIASTTVEVLDENGEYIEVEYGCVDCTPRDNEIELSCFAKVLRAASQFNAREPRAEHDDVITLATLIREYAATEKLSFRAAEDHLEQKLIEVAAEQMAEDYEDARFAHGDFLYDEMRDEGRF